MDPLHISLPGPLLAYLDAQVQRGGFDTPSAYIEQLVDRDRIWHTSEVEARLVAAIDSPQIHLSEAELAEPSLVGVLRRKLHALSFTDLS